LRVFNQDDLYNLRYNRCKFVLIINNQIAKCYAMIAIFKNKIKILPFHAGS